MWFQYSQNFQKFWTSPRQDALKGIPSVLFSKSPAHICVSVDFTIKISHLCQDEMVHFCNPSIGRLRQEDCWKYKASLGYEVSLRLAWTVSLNPASEKTIKFKNHVFLSTFQNIAASFFYSFDPQMPSLLITPAFLLTLDSHSGLRLLISLVRRSHMNTSSSMLHQVLSPSGPAKINNHKSNNF